MSIQNFLNWDVSVLYFLSYISYNLTILFSVDRMLLALFLFPKKCPCKTHFKTQCTKLPSPGHNVKFNAVQQFDKIYQIMYFQVTEDNRTLSTLFLSATREMHGGKLSCKVENPLVPNSEIKASQKLQIHCKSSFQIPSKFSWIVGYPIAELFVRDNIRKASL